MKTALFVRLLCGVACFSIMALTSCKKDDTTTGPGPSGFSVSSSSLSAAPGGTASATLSGGTGPYSLTEEPDTTIAKASLSGSTISVTAVTSGYTSIVVKDAANASLRVGISVTGPITYTIFPLTAGNTYVYAGYAINTSSNGSIRLPDPNNVYRTVWTLFTNSTPPGSWRIQDSTTLHLASVDVTVSRNLIVINNPTTGSFTFLQTLGPFFRALGVLPLGRTDTVRAVTIADPSLGIGGSWTAFDSSYTNATSATVRLQILGQLEAGETITDSANVTHNALRFRTYRNVFVGSSQVVSNATTSRLWLVKDVGPVQVHIAEDTENIGHFRVMRSKNF